MAKYTINVPASGGTITAATRTSDCVSNISINTSGAAPGIILSTGITGNDITITLSENSTSSARSCDCPISAMTTSGPCIGDSIQLIQSGSGPAPTDYAFGLKLKADANEGYNFLTNFQITDPNFFEKFTLTIGDDEVSLDGTMDGPLTSVGDVRDVDLSNSYTVKNESWQLTTTATAADSFTIQIGSTIYYFRPITGKFPDANGRYYMNATNYSANVTFHPDISVDTNAIYLYFNVGSLGF